LIKCGGACNKRQLSLISCLLLQLPQRDWAFDSDNVGIVTPSLVAKISKRLAKSVSASFLYHCMTLREMIAGLSGVVSANFNTPPSKFGALLRALASIFN